MIIQRGREAVVRLVPVTAPARQHRFGALAGKVRVDDAFLAPLPDDDLPAWER